jgi:hypothetical protein
MSHTVQSYKYPTVFILEYLRLCDGYVVVYCSMFKEPLIFCSIGISFFGGVTLIYADVTITILLTHVQHNV